MDKPLVSVVMIVCNVERFLAEAIESIVNQTFRDFEFIIVDFGSTDSSKSIISRYQAEDSRIKLHVVPHCRVAEARNASCSLAQGRYIALMDADDVAFRNRLERQVVYLEDHPEIAVLGGSVEVINESGRRLFTWVHPVTNQEIRKVLKSLSPFQQSTVVMRREAFCAVKGYRKAFSSAEDYDLWLRMLERYQGANLRKPLLYYRIHPRQMTIERLKQQVTEAVAGRAAANIRSQGGLDPMWQVGEITPEVLENLGVTDADIQKALVAGYSYQIGLMLWASQASTALQLFNELLELAPSQKIPRSARADGRLAEARIKYQQGKSLGALVAVGRAFLAWPIVAGRPLRRALNSFLVGWRAKEVGHATGARLR